MKNKYPTLSPRKGATLATHQGYDEEKRMGLLLVFGKGREHFGQLPRQ